MIFLIFLVLYVFTSARNSDLRESELRSERENNCLLISSLLTSAFVGGDGMVINTSIEHNVTINLTDINYRFLDVEGVSCPFAIRTVPNSKLRKGTVRIENRNNYIDIENV